MPPRPKVSLVRLPMTPFVRERDQTERWPYDPSGQPARHKPAKPEGAAWP